MNTSRFSRIAGAVLALLMLSACNDNDDSSRDDDNDDSIAMTAEKYALIDMALDELAKYELVPSNGHIVISDRTTISDGVERSLESEGFNLLTALDGTFPYDYLPWTPEESDLAFSRYYHANMEPVELRLEDMTVLERDISLLAHEDFKAYFTEDEYTGWREFYTDYPDAAGYMRFGNPVILEDERLALLHIDFIGDALFGNGTYVLFRLENGEWKFVNWYADWAS